MEIKNVFGSFELSVSASLVQWVDHDGSDILSSFVCVASTHVNLAF